MGQGRKEEALVSVQQAIGLAPDFPFPHNLHGRVMYSMGNMKEAEASFREAIRLDPDDADHYHQLAYVYFSRSRYEESLELVEQGLALAPEEVDGINLRGRLLIKLGREPEAQDAFEASINKNPENSYTHLNMGWAKLEAGSHKESLDHFREAVRLDPGNDAARAGLVEGLKARYWFYRMYLKFAFFMDSLNQKYRWALLIGLILVANTIPGIAPIYLGLVFFSWFSSILFNTLIRLNPYGRYALDEDQIFYSNIFAALLGGGIAALLGGKFGEIGLLENLGLVLLVLLFPLTGTSNQKYPAARKKSMIYALVLAGVGALFLALEGLGIAAASTVFLVFLFGGVAYTWWVQTLQA